MSKTCRKNCGGQGRPILPTAPPLNKATPISNVLTSPRPATVTLTPGKTSLRYTKTQETTADEQNETGKTALNEASSTVVPASKLTAGQNPNGTPRSDESTSSDSTAHAGFSMPLMIVSAVAGVCFLCALIAVVYACHAKKRSTRNKGNSRQANNDGNTATYIPVGRMSGTEPRESTAENPTYAEIGDTLFATLPSFVTIPSGMEQVRAKHRLGSATLPLISNEGYTEYARDEFSPTLPPFSPTLPPPRATYQEVDVPQQIAGIQKSQTLSGTKFYPQAEYTGYLTPTMRNGLDENGYLELIPEDTNEKGPTLYSDQATIPYEQIDRNISSPPQNQTSDANAYLPLFLNNTKGRKGDGYVDVDYSSQDYVNEESHSQRNGNIRDKTSSENDVDNEGRKIPSAPAYDGSLYFRLENHEEGRNNRVPVDPECQDYFVLENDSIPEKLKGQNADTHNEETAGTIPTDPECQHYFVLEHDSTPEKLPNGHSEQPCAKFTNEGNAAIRPGALDVLITHDEPRQTRITFSKGHDGSEGSDNPVCVIRDDKMTLCVDKAANDGEVNCYQQLPLVSPTEEDTEVYSKLNRGFMKNTLQR
ncbi:uncharacterized protein [Amphiura filiformis]|uniref:uncharacterized protein isoform X2 n=1 Tax=Amphiura filiformis TaxID=82378 RepID=UPI003B215905